MAGIFFRCRIFLKPFFGLNFFAVDLFWPNFFSGQFFSDCFVFCGEFELVQIFSGQIFSCHLNFS